MAMRPGSRDRGAAGSPVNAITWPTPQDLPGGATSALLTTRAELMPLQTGVRRADTWRDPDSGLHGRPRQVASSRCPSRKFVG
jgi:hypothetical protein